ncbi:mCG147638 [Mus musculus]|nr:mCG147638 [Mus musculus]
MQVSSNAGILDHENCLISHWEMALFPSILQRSWRPRLAAAHQSDRRLLSAETLLSEHPNIQRDAQRAAVY